MPNEDEGRKQAGIPLDLAMFHTLNTRATELSSNVSMAVEQLQSHMQQMVQSTAEAGAVCKSSVKHLSAEMESCTGRTAELISQCDQLDKDLSQLHDLSRQIKTMDKALDRLQRALR